MYGMYVCMSVCMYVYSHTHIYIYIHKHIHIHRHIHIHIHIHLHMIIYIYLYIYTFTRLYIYTFIYLVYVNVKIYAPFSPGLLFMLASIPGGASTGSSWSVHSSSARAGAAGALVSAVPLKAFKEAFERQGWAEKVKTCRVKLQHVGVMWQT